MEQSASTPSKLWPQVAASLVIDAMSSTGHSKQSNQMRSASEAKTCIAGSAAADAEAISDPKASGKGADAAAPLAEASSKSKAVDPEAPIELEDDQLEANENGEASKEGADEE